MHSCWLNRVNVFAAKDQSTFLDQIVYFTEKCLGNGRGIAGDPGPQVGTLLGDGAGDGAALHLPLVVHDHAGVILKISIV